MVGFFAGDLFLPPVLANGLRFYLLISHTHTLVWGNVDNVSASCKDMATLACMDCSCAKGQEPSPQQCANSQSYFQPPEFNLNFSV